MASSGPILRISLGLVLLTSTILMMMSVLGWIPEVDERSAELRINIARAVAAQATASIEQGDLRAVRAALRVLVDQNEDLLSAGLRSRTGQLMIVTGPHRQIWDPPEGDRSTSDHIRVPLFRSGEPWATVELRFRGLGDGRWPAQWVASPLLRMLLFTGVLGFFAYGFYMRRTLRYLDPSAVIPSRVQATLDVMTEGVIVIDPHGDIVMANRAFAARFRLRPTELMGRDAASLGWCDALGDEVECEFPWMRAIREGNVFVDETLTLHRGTGELVVLAVNGAPVLDGWGRPTGAIVTFDDVTELQRNRAALQKAHDEIEKSRDEIRLQNEELQLLARSDPLTGVANRRFFMDESQEAFRRARVEHSDLTLLMVDIDHFKKVNDQHGHVTGDEVIKRVAEGIAAHAEGRGEVCRYGGEEFCVALTGTSASEAETIGERVRYQISTPGFASVSVTVSIGMSSIRDGARSLTELIEQADEALYFSKEHGRNRLTRFDRMRPDPRS